MPFPRNRFKEMFQKYVVREIVPKSSWFKKISKMYLVLGIEPENVMVKGATPETIKGSEQLNSGTSSRSLLGVTSLAVPTFLSPYFPNSFSLLFETSET